MAWERRRNGRMYYYSATRVNGKVQKEYHGSSWKALTQSAVDRLESVNRAAEINARDKYLAELWQLDNIFKLTIQASREALYAAYLLAGYRRTKCHHWVLIKESKMGIPSLASLQELPPVDEGNCTNSQSVNSDNPEQITPTVGPDQAEKAAKDREPNGNQTSRWPRNIEETVNLIMAGRRDLLEVLQAQLAEVPELWRAASDLTNCAINGWAKKIGGEDLAYCESLKLAAATEREKLREESDTIMEQAIVDRFVLAKLQLAYLDFVLSVVDPKFLATKTGIAVEKRYRSAEYQFREAVRQLSKIRTIQQNMTPTAPANISLGLRLHNPHSTQSRKLA
jgi:hypothetical protein